MSRVEGANTTQFHYDRDGRLIAESDGAGAVIREYLWLGAKPLGLLVGPAGSATLYFVHADHLDRVQKITDASQVIVWDGQFTPYGRTHAIAGTIQNPLRFPGQWADPAASYFYNYMRDYDPTLARYLSVDPIGTAGGRNKFGYAGANPQSLTDPRGEFVQFYLAGAAGAAIGSYIGSYIGQRLAHWLSGDCRPFAFDSARAMRAAQWGFLAGLGGTAIYLGRGGIGLATALAGPASSIASTLGVQSAVSGATLGGGSLAGGMLLTAQQLGRAGETAAAIVRNTERIASATGTVAYRVPDVLSHAARIIGEVKNVGYLSYTSQIRDIAAYAAQSGYTFQLWVRSTTQLSGRLQTAILQGNIIVRTPP